MIKAGDLRHPVTLQRPVTAVSDRGRPVTSWETAARVMAGKQDVSGREFYAAHAVNAEDVVTWTIRWRDDIRPDWRLVHHGTAYGILEINHLGEMRDYIRLKTRAVTGQQSAAG